MTPTVICRRCGKRDDVRRRPDGSWECGKCGHAMPEALLELPTIKDLAEACSLHEVKPGDPAPAPPTRTFEEIVAGIQAAHAKMGNERR